MNECQLLSEIYVDLKYMKKEYIKNIKRQKRINRFLISFLIVYLANSITVNIYKNDKKGTINVK